MATSSEDDAIYVNIEQKHCFMCMFPSKKYKIVSFSVKTWTRFLEYVDKWKNLEGPQTLIAKKYAALRTSYAAEQIPTNGGFHQICYTRFTDSQRIVRALKSIENKVAAASKVSTSQGDNREETDENEPPTKKSRSLRSSFEPPSVPARSKYILPSICILCQKEKTVVCRFTGKRRRELLVSCSTIDAVKLKQAVAESGNESLLMQIKDQDCVAIEVKYHRTCYRTFTRYLSKPAKMQNPKETTYNEAFEIFSKRVKTKIIENKEIMRLKKLNELFIKQIKETHGVDARTYKTTYLKQRLIKKFPQLCFLRPQRRTEGYLVYVNDIPTSTLVEEKTIFQETTQTTSETDSTTENDTDLPSQKGISEQPNSPHTDPFHLRNMFITSIELKNTVRGVKTSLPWPPTSEILNLKEAEKIVPHILYNFLAWIVGASEEPQTDKKVDVSAPIHRKLLSISQDLISLASKGRTLMPKHLSLAMAVRHLSGSAQLIELLNGFGHCTSNSVVLNHDTALAELEICRGENSLPSNIQLGIPTTLVWDNNDFGEETLSGRGTTHNTNGIIIQRSANPPNDEPSFSNIPVTSVKRTKRRSMQPPEVKLAIYSGKKKEGPVPFAEHVSLLQSDNAPSLQYPMQLDSAYYLMRLSTDSILPSWTGFNQLLSQIEVPPKSVIGYLPVIDSSPTEMDTVLTILQRSIEIADKLQLETIVIVMDQAIYAKAQQIRWRNPQFMERLVIRLGAFHTAMSFLGCLGKRFRDAGLQDIMIESEIIAAGSVNGVFSGKHYNRAVRVHKLVAEAMQHMRLISYLNNIPEVEAEKVKSLITALSQSFPGPQYQQIIKGESFHSFMSSYQAFIQASNKTQTFVFWSSYIDMVEVLLLFLRGTREANWELHLTSVRKILPWMFAYDHVNYSRYLSVYWLEMCNLPFIHPEIHKQCLEGAFAVQRSHNAFATISCDQTIEQTANRDSKSKGGMTGFSTSKGAVNRWIWSHHARGSITRECEAMAGKGEHSETRSDLLPSRMKRDKTDVEKIVDTVNSMVNPFDYEQDELIHIASGVVATQYVQTDLQSANARGESEFIKFCEQRLQRETVDFFASIKKMNLKTFTSMSKISRHNVHGKDITLKADRNLLARLVVIGKYRKINLQELLSYSLGPLPLSLADSQGFLVKTNKANLLHALESLPEKSLSKTPIIGGIYVVDGMALLHQLNVNKLPGERTFLNLSLIILKRLVNWAKHNSSQEIHFVTDTYQQISIKNAERAKRAASGSQVIRIHGQFLPQQWNKFLSVGENKESLVKYLFETWSNVSTSELIGVKVFLAHNSKCHSFSPGKHANHKVTTVEETRLCTSQEEADTRIFLHAFFAASTSADVIIVSPDTDVFINGIALQSLIPARLYFHTGKATNLRTIDLQTIEDCIGYDISQALIGLHCFTGCDSVSAFYGKGKKKALNFLLKEKEFCHAFRNLGEQFDVQPDTAAALEVFVCRLYGQPNKSVNDARYNLFRLQTKLEITMPPNQDALKEHIKRANYQAGIYKRSLQAYPDVPTPDGHGWKIEDGELVINWMNLPPAPESLLELSNCSSKCKKSQCHDVNICTCLQNNVPCTDICKCTKSNCCEISTYTIVDDSDDDTDYEGEIE